MNPRQDVPEYLYHVLTVAYVAISVTGTIGNSLTICALLYYKKLRTLQNAFLINLAVSDLTVCFLLIPGTLLAQKGFIGKGSGFCHVLGYVSLVCLLNSTLSLALIATNRYVSICKSRDLYCKLFSRTKASIFMGLSWLIPITMVSPPLWTSDGRFGHFDFNRRLGTCLFDDVENRVMHIMMLVLADCCIVFPALGCSFFCYYSIVVKFFKSSRKVAMAPQLSVASQHQEMTENESTNGTTNGSTNGSTKGSTNGKKPNKKAMILVKNLLTIFVTFNICWFPMVFIYRIDYKSTLSHSIFHMLFLLAQSNSCLNFIIYLSMNTQFRNAYLGILTFGKRGGVK